MTNDFTQKCRKRVLRSVGTVDVERDRVQLHRHVEKKTRTIESRKNEKDVRRILGWTKPCVSRSRNNGYAYQSQTAMKWGTYQRAPGNG
uniref:Transposase n=1 Tax=Haemonchus contortus TaxID=6289 RepID=A0A7I4Y5U2_HAECO